MKDDLAERQRDAFLNRLGMDNGREAILAEIRGKLGMGRKAMTTYHVYQSFETLGDPGLVKCHGWNSAERHAEVFREELAAYIADLRVDPEDGKSVLGPERAAWEGGRKRSNGPKGTYGKAGGQYIADKAVRIEEVSDGEAS
jgi:hypothetical protein